MSDNKTLWILHDKTVSVAIQNKNFFNTLIKHKNARYIIQSDNNKFYFSGGGSDEVIKYDLNFNILKKYKIQNLNYKTNGKNTLCAVFYNGKPYFAGYNSLFVLDEKIGMIVPWKLKSFNLSDDITEPRAMIVYKDNLLIPTKRGGIIKLNLKNGNQSIFHLRDSTKSNYPNWHFYRDLFVDNKNRLLITSENGTAFTKDAKTFRYFNRKSKNNQGKMIGLTDRIAISKDGKIWL